MTQNDKIVELIKAFLDHKVLQPTTHQPHGCYAGLNSTIESVITSIIANPDSFKIKPETKPILVRNWLTKGGAVASWYQSSGVTQETMEKLPYFKQWLDTESRVYEVEI
jgi:hypothetical protein